MNVIKFMTTKAENYRAPYKPTERVANFMTTKARNYRAPYTGE